MKKAVITFTTTLFILFISIGCEESGSTSGTGYVYADTTGGNTMFGNLLNMYTSKTSQYVEMKFEGNVGEESGTGVNNMLNIPIWYKDSDHYYVCSIFEGDLGGLDPDIGVLAYINDGTNQDTYVGNPIDSTITDIFPTSDVSEKTFGCELIDESGTIKIKAYLNGTLYSTYEVGSNSNVVDSSVDAADPGIASSTVVGRPGFGINYKWGTLKINSYVVYDKKPQ